MDLGSFGVDQELEQADRLQQQALQLLQHAGSARPWSPRFGKKISEVYSGGSSADWPEDPASSWETCSEHFRDGSAPMSGRDQAILAAPSSRQKKLSMRSLYDQGQTGQQANDKTSATEPSQTEFMQTAGADFKNGQSQAPQSRTSDISSIPIVDLRPFIAAAHPWSAKDGQAEVPSSGPSPRPLSNGAPSPAGSLNTFTTEALHSMLLGQLDMPTKPSAPQPPAPSPATAPPGEHGASDNIAGGHVKSILPAPLTGPHRGPPFPRQASFPYALLLAHDDAATKPSNPRQNLPRRPPLQDLSPCRSAPSNALQMFSSTSLTDVRRHPTVSQSAPSVSQSAPTTIPATWRKHPPSSSRGPVYPPLAPLLPRVADINPVQSTSANTSGTTWPSIDRESFGTTPWCPSVHSTVTQDFQEVLSMYLGLVRELEQVGVRLLQEPGVKPTLLVWDAPALHAFADSAGEAPPRQNGSAAAAAGAASGAAAPAESPFIAPPQAADAAMDASARSSGEARAPSGAAAAGALPLTDGAPAVHAATAELTSGLANMFKNMRLLDFTARKLEVYAASAAVGNSGAGHAEPG